MSRPPARLDEIAPDAPLRLDTAAALAFPDGSMTASGLRREAERGRLAIERIAGKDFTTLAAIAEMRKLCRQSPKDQGSGSARHDAIGPDDESLTPPFGSSSTASIKRAQAAAEITMSALKSSSKLTSTASTPSRRKKNARDPDQIPVADVLNLYAEKVAPGHARPKETAQKIGRLLAFFGRDTLADINGDRCRQFVAARSTAIAAREDLIVLRSAINFHRHEGHCHKVVSIILPRKAVSREKWCTRSQVAKLIWIAWRSRELQDGKPTNRRPWRHVAKFLLITAYTGTRSGASCAAALEPTEGKGWIDVERGIFYRRPKGARETKKRRPPVPIPNRLLAHLRRWKRLGQHYAVEWHGEPVHDCDKAFRNVARTAELPWVTPHIMRHTCGTWLAQSGAPIWQSAGFLGMTVRQFEAAQGRAPLSRSDTATKTVRECRLRNSRIRSVQVIRALN